MIDLTRMTDSDDQADAVVGREASSAEAWNFHFVTAACIVIVV